MKSDTIESIFDAIKERISSVFLFNIIISFIILKWEFVYFTLYDSYVNYKPGVYLIIAKNLLGKGYSWKHVLSYATLITISFPIINQLYRIFKYSIYKVSDIAEVYIDKKVPYADHQFADLKLKYNNLDKNYKSLISNELKTIEELENTKDTLQKEEKINSELRSSQLELRTENSNLKEQLLNLEKNVTSYSKKLELLEKTELTYKSDYDAVHVENLKLKEDYTSLLSEYQNINVKLSQSSAQNEKLQTEIKLINYKHQIPDNLLNTNIYLLSEGALDLYINAPDRNKSIILRKMSKIFYENMHQPNAVISIKFIDDMVVFEENYLKIESIYYNLGVLSIYAKAGIFSLWLVMNKVDGNERVLNFNTVLGVTKSPKEMELFYFSNGLII